jgi:acyl-CoA dehydrogenase
LLIENANIRDWIADKEAQTEIAAIKVAAPNIALKIVDRAIQVHGGAG